MKQGSFWKNWKRRYFNLRKDIQSLVYYHNADDLTQLGLIPLSSLTTITLIDPRKVGNLLYVFSLFSPYNPSHILSSPETSFSSSGGGGTSSSAIPYLPVSGSVRIRRL